MGPPGLPPSLHPRPLPDLRLHFRLLWCLSAPRFREQCLSVSPLNLQTLEKAAGGPAKHVT